METIGLDELLEKLQMIRNHSYVDIPTNVVSVDRASFNKVEIVTEQEKTTV
jgi:hypothetical protein